MKSSCDDLEAALRKGKESDIIDLEAKLEKHEESDIDLEAELEKLKKSDIDANDLFVELKFLKNFLPT